MYTMKKIEEKLKEKWMDKLKENYPEGKAETVDYDVFMDAIMKASPVEVWFDETASYSRYRRTENQIVIPGWKKKEDKMQLAIREVSYALCHKREQKAASGEEKRWTRKIMEGTGVYYMVCNYFGLDIKEPLMPNIGEGGRYMYMEMDDLCSFMETIWETASYLIDAIAENMQGQQKKGMKKEYRKEELEDLYMEFLQADIEKKNRNEFLDQPLQFQYYVVNDFPGKKAKKVVQYFTDLNLAFKEYLFLPNHLDKRIGMESLDEQGDSIYLVECLNGWDEIRELGEGLPNEKWICKETRAAMQKARSFVDNPNTRIAYKMEKGYFSIQTILNEFHYKIYDDEFKVLDSGIYDCPDTSIRNAMSDILFNDEIRPEECHVIDYKEFEKEQKWVSTPTISDRTEPEQELNGLSCAEAEEMIVQEMQKKIKRLDLEDKIKIYGIRVCGARTTELPFEEKTYTDIDAVVFFDKDTKEDCFSINLVWDYIQIGNISVDVTPVSIADINSLEDYMQQKDQNLKEKETQQKPEKNLISNPKSSGDNINEVKHEPGNKADHVREPPNQRKSVIQRLRNRQVQISEKKCKRHKQVTAACKRGSSR